MVYIRVAPLHQLCLFCILNKLSSVAYIAAMQCVLYKVGGKYVGEDPHHLNYLSACLLMIGYFWI